MRPSSTNQEKIAVSKIAGEIEKLWTLFLYVRKLTPAVSDSTTGDFALRSAPWYSDRVSLPNYSIKFDDLLTEDVRRTLRDMPAWLNELYIVNLYALLDARGRGFETQDLSLFQSHEDRCKCSSCLVTLIEGLRNRFAHTGGVYRSKGSIPPRAGKPDDDALLKKLQDLYPAKEESNGSVFPLRIDKVLEPLTEDLKAAL